MLAECERLSPNVVIIDSVQTLSSDRFTSAPGSITQVRESAMSLIAYAKNSGASVIIKGLRAVSDFEYEFQMAQINKKMCPEVETLFMMTGQEYSYLSSSIVKEVARLGGNIDTLVSERVAKSVIEKVNLK